MEQLVGNLGFPIAVAVYLLWTIRDERRKCDERYTRLEQQVAALVDRFFGNGPDGPRNAA